MTPAEQLGYRFALVAGKLPDGLSLPFQAMVFPVFDGVISLNWSDRSTDGQDPIDFTVQIVVVDSAGNESVPQIARVYDDPGGCGILARSGPISACAAAVAIAALAAAMLAARRRRGPVE